MRRFCLTLGGLLLAPALTMAQQPIVDPNAAQMEEVLGQWETRITAMNSVVTTCSRITIKKALESVETYTGQAKLLKMANQPCRASFALYKDGKPDIYDKMICTGTSVYCYDPSNKVVYAYDQPAQGSGQLNGNSFLDFLFGMRAEQAKQRYEIVYVPSADKNYHYLRILPRTEEDKREFKELRVALNKESDLVPRQLWFLPRRVLFLKSNDDEETWDFLKISPNADVRPLEFAPDTPAGWQIQHVRK